MKLPPALVLSALFITQGLVNDPEDDSKRKDWPCFVGFMPDDSTVPNNAVCLYDVPSVQEGREMRSGKNVEHPGIQLRVRGSDYVTASAKMDALVTYINTVYLLRFDVGNYIYELQSISNGSVLPLGVETTGKTRRHVFTCNLALSMLEDDVHAAVGLFHNLVHVTMPTNMALLP